MDHRELEDIAADALLKRSKTAYVSQTVAEAYENAIAVIDVVEPIIRADERHEVETDGTDITRWHQGLVLAYLRAQVEALRETGLVNHWVYQQAITDVLALLDGAE